tara:strand:+ start:227 stop:853 length:627 start_codon:yes stop_codon:yes gene_type:complete
MKKPRPWAELQNLNKLEKIKNNILASKSPRRKYILNQIGFKFSVVPSNFKEDLNSDFPPEALAESLARGKAMKIARMYNDKIIIGADTVVYLDDKFYGKPKNSQESFEMLRSLSGKSHEVITGVSLILINKNIDYTFYQKTVVTIADMTDEEILSYIKEYNPQDKAGSYGIQDGFSAFIKNLSGCYFNVMGFPISKFFNQYKMIFKSL